MALVLYTDEHLATNNKLPEKGDIHTKVGSVLLISTLMSFVGAATLMLIYRNISLSPYAMLLAILSAIPIVAMYASYFYLLQTYPVNQVGPLFQISSIWLLLFEIMFGGSISLIGLLGIGFLLYGAYILDTGTFKWRIPTKLLFLAIPATSTLAISLMMARLASRTDSVTAFTFWQMFAMGVVGIFLLFVKKFREGFIYRIKHQGKRFLGFSLFNETFAESSILFSNLAVGIAPVAAYVTALSGVESVFVLALFYFFPQGKRAKVTRMQWLAVALITVGIFLVESRTIN